MKTMHYGSEQFNWPYSLLREEYERGTYRSGVTEPWIAQTVAALLTASGAQAVLELGSYLGHTTSWLADALERGGGGRLLAVEIDPKRATATRTKLTMLRRDGRGLEHVQWEVIEQDSIHVLKHLPHKSIEFCWLDDDHHVPHVHEELLRLTSDIMAPGGIICMHDVTPNTIGLDAVCKEFGGYVLDFPHLGPAGGLGIIQV